MVFVLPTIGNTVPAEWYKDFDEFGRHFLPPPKVGGRVVRRELGQTLQELSVHPESLYSGSLAEKIERQAVKDGGALRVSDLSEHETDWVVPVTCRYPQYDSSRDTAKRSGFGRTNSVREY